MYKLISILLVLFFLAPVNLFAANTCVDLKTNVTIGSKNSGVYELQNFLYDKGYLNVTPTGYFGPLTIKAVKQFQLDNAIINTGFVGPLTRSKINSLSCAQSNACPDIAKLCPDGVTAMPKDVTCNFLPDKCPTTNSPSSSSNFDYKNFSAGWLSNISPTNAPVLIALKSALSFVGVNINSFATTTMTESEILDMTRKFEQDYIFGNK